MMACRQNRCSRCGRIRNSATAKARAAAACAVQESVSAELYGYDPDEITYTTCCDAYGGCKSFPLANRCPYWPAFAHPRWLTCDQLYSRRRVSG